MHSFEYILVMLGAVLLSNLISQRFPRISTPLIQIGLGIAIALMPFLHFDMSLDPELFLVLFIAPLLFEDAKKANKPMLWRLKRPILLLALGLVFTTCLAVGGFVNWLVPAIPLAAAIALAAALAPTDAVAVSSLKESITITEDQEGLLQGEALFNDASSIVSFQFALAALAVGPFAAAAGEPGLVFFGDVAITFAVMFLGGVATGIVLMLLRYALVRFLRARGVDSITFHVLFEIVTPFIVFLIAEALHVSGIIAVVTAGIAHSFGGRSQTPTKAMQNIVSGSVWSVIGYALNGVVFLILGTQLPGLTMHLWQFSEVGHLRLIVAVVAILAAIMLLRLIWVFVMHRNSIIVTRKAHLPLSPQVTGVANAAEVTQVTGVANAAEVTQQATYSAFPMTFDSTPSMTQVDESITTIEEMAEARHTLRTQEREQSKLDVKAQRRAAIAAERSAPGYFKAHVHDALVLSLTGVKGAITLALLLTIPLTLSDGADFPQRSLLLFLASCIIMLSLLLANFVLPLIAPKVHEALQPEDEVRAIMDICRNVIHRLSEQMTPQNKQASESVIRQYNNRLITYKQNNNISDPDEDELRRRIIAWEREYTLELIDEDKVSLVVGTMYLYQLSRMLSHIEHHGERQWLLKGFFDQLRHRFLARRFRANKESALNASEPSKEQRQALRGEAAKMGRHSMAISLQELQRVNYRNVLRKLDTLMAEPGAPIRAINMVVSDFRRRLSRTETFGRPLTGISVHKNKEYEMHLADVESAALAFEREAIRSYQEHGRISRETAAKLFDNVAMMELDIEEHLE
ncbi:MAG: cation:proton antiporter [Coriobacteriales bacterium]|jgi:CPA1 family monovalent cation:H+ antiporter|nr:cation:proton antiporter [Coriobacteriales bacterium]